MRLEYNFFLAILSVILLQSCEDEYFYTIPQKDRGNYYVYDMGVKINGEEYHEPRVVPSKFLQEYRVYLYNFTHHKNQDLFYISCDLEKLISLRDSSYCTIRFEYCDSLKLLSDNYTYSTSNQNTESISLVNGWRNGEIRETPIIGGDIILSSGTDYTIQNGTLGIEGLMELRGNLMYNSCKEIRFDFTAVSADGRVIEVTDGYFNCLNWMKYWYRGPLTLE